VTRDFSRRDQHRVEADVLVDIVRVERQPGRGGCRDPALLARLQRFRCGIERGARFDLDKHQHAAAPRHDIDLADRAAKPPRRDAIALRHEIGRGAALG
jgi:hypothetical protein